MKLITAYIVHASGAIVRQGRYRKPGSVEIGAIPVTVALEAAPGVDWVISQAELDGILGDIHLKRHKLRLPAAAPAAAEEPAPKKAPAKPRTAPRKRAPRKPTRRRGTP